MPLVHIRDIVSGARSAGRGVAAFNVITLEHAEAIANGAQAAGLPAILQISQNTVAYHHGELLPLASAAAAVARGASVPLALHLDHVEDVALLHASYAAGFTSAMFDASKLPYEENVAATKDAVEWAHAHDMWLEAELGEIGGKDGAHAPGARTDPDEASRYVEATGVDTLAVAVGSSHAMTTRSAILDHALIARLRDAVPVPLVLHGSSGVGDKTLAGAVAAGITKINIGTALNISFTDAVRRVLEHEPDTVDPRRYLRPAGNAMAATVEHLLRVVSNGT